MTFQSRQALPKDGIILILNGTSSSGKTSIARGIQSLLSEPYHHLQLDSFRDMEPPDYWRDWQQQGSDVISLKMAALCRAMNAALVEYSRHGQNIVFDTEFSNQDAWQCVLDDLVESPVLIVGVMCSPAVLAERERRRGDRKVGLAASQLDRIHKGKEYDFTIDTTASSAADCAVMVADWLRRPPVPQAFLRMSAARAMTSRQLLGSLPM